MPPAPRPRRARSGPSGSGRSRPVAAPARADRAPEGRVPRWTARRQGRPRQATGGPRAPAAPRDVGQGRTLGRADPDPHDPDPRAPDRTLRPESIGPSDPDPHGRPVPPVMASAPVVTAAGRSSLVSAARSGTGQPVTAPASPALLTTPTTARGPARHARAAASLRLPATRPRWASPIGTCGSTKGAPEGSTRRARPAKAPSRRRQAEPVEDRRWPSSASWSARSGRPPWRPRLAARCRRVRRRALPRGPAMLQPMAKEVPSSAVVRELYGLTLYRLGQWKAAARRARGLPGAHGRIDRAAPGAGRLLPGPNAATTGSTSSGTSCARRPHRPSWSPKAASWPPGRWPTVGGSAEAIGCSSRAGRLPKAPARPPPAAGLRPGRPARASRRPAPRPRATFGWVAAERPRLRRHRRARRRPLSRSGRVRVRPLVAGTRRPCTLSRYPIEVRQFEEQTNVDIQSLLGDDAESPSVARVEDHLRATT